MSFPSLSQITQSIKDVFNSPSRGDLNLGTAEAHRLCPISDPSNITQSEEQYFACAQELRKEAKYAEARTILRSLRLHSSNPAMQSRAGEAFKESMDGDRGGVISFLKNVFAFQPPYSIGSDEDTANGVVEIGSIGAGLVTFAWNPLSLVLIGLGIYHGHEADHNLFNIDYGFDHRTMLTK